MSIPSWCRVGQRVICIDAADSSGRYVPFGSWKWTNPLTLDATYIIRAIARHPFYDGPCVHLVGVARAAPFGLFRFRPAVDDKTNDEIEARLFRQKHSHVGGTFVSKRERVL